MPWRRVAESAGQGGGVQGVEGGRMGRQGRKRGDQYNSQKMYNFMSPWEINC